MAYANFRIRHLTHSSLMITLFSIIGLLTGTLLIFYYEFQNQPQQLLFVGGIYLLLTGGAWFYVLKNSIDRLNNMSQQPSQKGRYKRVISQK